MKISDIKCKLGHAIKNPKLFINYILKRMSWIPDKLYLNIYYYINNKERINISKPRTFNEKLNWLKLYDRKSFYTRMVDKYEVKELVERVIGKHYVVKNFGVWDNVDDIDWESLPNSFILKCTHDSGGMCICRNKASFDINVASSILKHAQTTDCFYISREWPYKNVKHRIIADELLDDGRPGELQDYKFWCFNGKPRVMYLTNKGTSIYENFYDMNFNPLDIDHGFPRFKPEYDKPKEFDLMKSLAEKLSKDIPFVRVDFFYVNGQVFFGEFTFFDWGGVRKFTSKEWDKTLGDWIKLPSTVNKD